MRNPTHARLVVAVALAAGALTAPRVARADDWATLGLDGARTRLAAERSGAGFSGGHWTFAPKGGARVLSSPVVADGFAITADLDGNVSALRADSGALAWRTNASSPVQGTPAIARGRVFIPTLGNKLIALALADGSPLWTADLGGMAVSSPAIVGTDVVLSAGFPQRRLVRLDGSHGRGGLAEPARHGRAQQQLARRGRRPDRRRQQRRPLLRVRRRDRRAALGLPGRRSGGPGLAADPWRARLYGGRRRQRSRARDRRGDRGGGAGLANHAGRARDPTWTARAPTATAPSRRPSRWAGTWCWSPVSTTRSTPTRMARPITICRAR